MAWTNWPYWLKGGIIGVLIAIILDGLIGLSVFLPGGWAFGYQFLWIPIITPILIVGGFIIGWIVGLIKSSKK